MVILYDNSEKGALKKQSLSFDMDKTFDEIKSSHKSDFFIQKRNASCVCTYPKLPSSIQLAKKENEYTENNKTIFSVIN